MGPWGDGEVRHSNCLKIISIHVFMNSFFIYASIHVFTWVSFICICLVIIHLFMHEILIYSKRLHSVLTHSFTFILTLTHSFTHMLIRLLNSIICLHKIHIFNHNLLIFSLSVKEAGNQWHVQIRMIQRDFLQRCGQNIGKPQELV